MTKKNSLIFLSISLVYSLFCLFQLGTTWDTFYYYELGKGRLDYLFSLGQDQSYKEIPHNKYLPAAYSTLAAFFVQIFPKKYLVLSLYFCNFLFSFASIIGIYKISKKLFNETIGKITFLICFFTPAFFGHMAINPIDTVIVFSNIWFFYLLLSYFKKQNTVKKNKYVFLSGLCLGLGIGVRNSFVVTVIPFFIFFILNYISSKSLFSRKFLINKFLIDTLKVIAIAYLFMVLLWPHTHENILTMPFKLAYEGLSFGFGVPYTLLNGEFFSTGEFPKSYLIKNLFFRLPEYVIISYLVFIILFFQISRQFSKTFTSFNLKILLILFVVFFPNILIVFSPYPLYDGIRLFLFIIPYIAVIPSVMIYYLYKNSTATLNKIFSIILIIFTAFFAFNFFNLTPYQYVYLNAFAGKISDHSKKFENDYWGISTKKLISKIRNNQEILKSNNIKFTTCGIEQSSQANYLKKIKNLKFKLVNYNENYDYIIMNNRITFGKEKNPNKVETCFERFEGEDLIEIKVRGLVISKITKNTNN